MGGLAKRLWAKSHCGDKGWSTCLKGESKVPTIGVAGDAGLDKGGKAQQQAMVAAVGSV